jgi:hypothetical protein
MAECVGGFKNKLLRTEDIMGLIMNFAHNPGAGVSGLRFQATKEDDLTGVDLTLTLLPGHVSTNVPAQVSGNDFLCTFCVQLGPDRLFAIGWFVSVMDRGREAMGMLHLIEETEDATTAPPKTPFEINILIKDFRRN